MKIISLLLERCLCDYRCIFCSRGTQSYISSLKKDLDTFDYALESVQIRGIIRKGYDQGCRKIIIGNNEPLNHPEIINIVRLARDIGYNEIVIHTSGIRFRDRGFTAKIKKAGLTHVELPIYGTRKEIHDSIVCMDGAYDILMESIRNLKDTGIMISFSTVLLRQNLGDMKELIRRYSPDLRYPHPISGILKDYKKVSVKISTIPKSLSRNLDLAVPCLTGRYSYDLVQEKCLRYNPRNSKMQDALHNQSKRKVHPRVCKECSCKEFCQGIYPAYLRIHGNEEFKPFRYRPLKVLFRNFPFFISGKPKA